MSEPTWKVTIILDVTAPNPDAAFNAAVSAVGGNPPTEMSVKVKRINA